MGFSILKVERQKILLVKKVNDFLVNFSSIGILNSTLNRGFLCEKALYAFPIIFVQTNLTEPVLRVVTQQRRENAGNTELCNGNGKIMQWLQIFQKC